jgi:hypothetical protein
VFYGWCGSVYIWLPRYGWTRPCLCVCVCVSLSVSARPCCVAAAAAAVVVIMCRRWACCPMGDGRCAMVTRSVGGPQPRSSKATTGSPGQHRRPGTWPRQSSRAAEQKNSMSDAVAGVTVDALPGHGSDAEVQRGGPAWGKARPSPRPQASQCGCQDRCDRGQAPDSRSRNGWQMAIIP